MTPEEYREAYKERLVTAAAQIAVEFSTDKAGALFQFIVERLLSSRAVFEFAEGFELREMLKNEFSGLISELAGAYGALYQLSKNVVAALVEKAVAFAGQEEAELEKAANSEVTE